MYPLSTLNRKLFFLLAFFANFTCYAQIPDFDISYYSLTHPSGTKISVPVTAIEVHDARFDTLSVGIDKSFSKLQLIRLKKGLEPEIRQFYTEKTQLSANDSAQRTLHCFIKKFILSDHIYVDNPEEQRNTSRKFDATEQAGVLFVAEFYEHSSGVFIPLYRFDTTVTGLRSVTWACREYTEMALAASLDKLKQIDWEKIRQQGKKLSRKNIDDYYSSRLALPILTVAAPARGIYLNYEDFRNNKPQPQEFTIDKGSKGDFLYIKNEKGEDRLLTDLWGYSDGKDAYIFSASNYFKLLRSGNGYNIYGAKDFTGKRKLRLNFGVLDLMAPNSNYAKSQTRMRYSLKQSYLRLDMETGELF